MRAKYGNKAMENSIGMVYFIFIVAYGYSVLQDTPCHHFWIGGSQTDWKGLYEGLPFHDDPEIFLYCLINHAYHFYSLLDTMFFEERMNDYETMLIHHVAANILLVTSNYGSCHRYGAVVLFLHDVPDIFVCLLRIFDSMGWDLLTLTVGFIPMTLSWFYLRLLYFPWIIYGIVFYCKYPDHLSDMNEYLKT